MIHDLITALIAAAGQGPVSLVELRGQNVEEKKWIGKQDGKPASMFVNTIAAEFVETGAQVTLELMAPKGATAMLPVCDDHGKPLPRGTKCLAVILGYESDFKGTRGRLKALTPWNGVASEPAKEAPKK